MRKDSKMELIMQRLEEGVDYFFKSEKYQDYLDVMCKFHDYSLNNQLLIAMQNPDATYVAGYRSWQNNFERHVKQGEKAILIMAPVKKYYEVETGEVDTRGEPIMKKQEYITFRPVYVFDVSQTEGKEHPSIATRLDGKVDNFDDFMFSLRAASPYSFNIMEMGGTANGLCNYATETISIRAGMSEAQTLKTAVHETAHARVHSMDDNKGRRQKEVEAESIAYVVCNYFGLDTSDYSFGYVAGWAGDKDNEILRKSMETIRDEAYGIIDVVEKGLRERKEKINDLTPTEVEEYAKEALADSIAELGFNSRIVGARYYGYSRMDEEVCAKVMVEYAGTDREDTLFNEVNENPVIVNGVRLDINPINEEKSGDLESYYQMVKTFEREDMTDDSWPMVTVVHSTYNDIAPGKMNIYEAKTTIDKAESKLAGKDVTASLRIKLSFTYEGEKREITDIVHIGEGRDFIEYLNVSSSIATYMNRHIQLLDTVHRARTVDAISPGTIHQDRYEDMMYEWAEEQRRKLNYNTIPDIEKPPSYRGDLVKQHEEWEMIK
ncbi:MAG: hypothetical protein IJX12_05765 [Lachnospiraceae bacterium]|nr:hypothetical protein [Lachnospiraceae bacterium]